MFALLIPSNCLNRSNWTKPKAAFIRNTKVRFQAFKLDTFFWEPRSDNIAVTDAWLVALKSNKRRPHPVTI